MAVEHYRHEPPLWYCVEVQVQLVEEYWVKVAVQRVHVVGLVQLWQLDMTVEHGTHAPEDVSWYYVEVQDVQLAPLAPLAQSVQYEEELQVKQSVMARPQEIQVCDCK